jgi:hypothetical protein
MTRNLTRLFLPSSWGVVQHRPGLRTLPAGHSSSICPAPVQAGVHRSQRPSVPRTRTVVLMRSPTPVEQHRILFTIQAREASTMNKPHPVRAYPDHLPRQLPWIHSHPRERPSTVDWLGMLIRRPLLPWRLSPITRQHRTRPSSIFIR